MQKGSFCLVDRKGWIALVHPGRSSRGTPKAGLSIGGGTLFAFLLVDWRYSSLSTWKGRCRCQREPERQRESGG